MSFHGHKCEPSDSVVHTKAESVYFFVGDTFYNLNWDADVLL